VIKDKILMRWESNVGASAFTALSAGFLMAVVLTIGLPSIARAAGSPIDVQAHLVTECLQGHLQPSSLVAEYKISVHDFKLYCGSPISTGVLHIDSGHPIEGHERDFAQCASKLFLNGHESTGVQAYNLMWHWQPNLDFSVRAFHETDGRIITIFTGNGMGNRDGTVSSNAWAFCARL